MWPPLLSLFAVGHGVMSSDGLQAAVWSQKPAAMSVIIYPPVLPFFIHNNSPIKIKSLNKKNKAYEIASNYLFIKHVQT